MGKEFTSGVMDDTMRASIKTTKKMALGSTFGAMAGLMKDFGKMANNMEKENMSCRIKRSNGAFGIKVKELSGLKMNRICALLKKIAINDYYFFKITTLSKTLFILNIFKFIRVF
jgi:hypothetical protein